MQGIDLNVLLNKAEELKSLFLIGKDLIPLLEEIFIFIKEIQPIIEEINTTLEDNIKKMPSASEQLSKVSEANEVATTQIIDTVESIIQKIDNIGQHKQNLKEINMLKLGEITQLFDEISDSIKEYDNLSFLVPKIKGANSDITNILHEQLVLDISQDEIVLNDIKDNLFSIMMSLQIQDITTQQLASVSHSLHTVYVKLTGIVDLFYNSSLLSLDKTQNIQKENTMNFHRSVAFDPNAIDCLDDNSSKQNVVDEIFQQNHNSLETTSQNEIDKMFSQS